MQRGLFLNRIKYVLQAYLMKYDSTHGILKSDVHAVDDKTLQVGSQAIKVFGCRYELYLFSVYLVS